MANSSELAVEVPGVRTGRLRLAVGCYAVAVGAALAIEGALNTTAGAALCAALVAVLLNHHVVTVGSEPDAGGTVGSASDARGVFLVLALIPLAGVLAVVMPIANVIPAAWPLLTAAPLILALVLTARQLDPRREAVGLTLRHPVYQVLIALLGVPLGYLAYVGLRPPVLDGGALGLAAVSLTALAFAEELLFRGLLQPRLCRLYGAAGIAVTAVLSATVALGAHSLAYGVFAAIVAGGFGLAAARTGSIAGTTAARAMMFVGLLIVWPLVLG